MQITYLFGNGFDVNLGLKTRYEDFYPTYFESCKSLSDDNSIKTFSQKIKENYESWSDFEWAFSQTAEGTYQEIGDIIADFNDKFADFLRIQSEGCNYEDIENGKKEMSKFILEPYSFLERRDKQKLQEYFIKHRSETHSHNFVSLNYTDTLEKLLENNKYLPEYHFLGANKFKNDYKSVLQLHGSIKEGYIIVGVDSLEQFRSEEMKKNERLSRHCVKRIINEQNGYIEKENNFISMINASNVICVFGVAFGETDRSRWNLIRDWIKKDRTNKLIIFKYNSQFGKLDRMSKGPLLDAIDDAKNEYLKLLGIEGEFEKYYDQVFVADSSKALKIKLIKADKNELSA